MGDKLQTKGMEGTEGWRDGGGMRSKSVGRAESEKERGRERKKEGDKKTWIRRLGHQNHGDIYIHDVYQGNAVFEQTTCADSPFYDEEEVSRFYF